MPISELLSKGLELMLLGMGTVFVFLAVLVFAVTKLHEAIFIKTKPWYIALFSELLFYFIVGNDCQCYSTFMERSIQFA